MKKRFVSQVELFKGIKPETLENILNLGKIVKVPKHSFLIRAKEPVSAIYLQVSGKSIVYNLTHGGKRKILFVCGQGSLLNYNLMDDFHSAVFCETIEESEVFAISVGDFAKCLEKDWKLVQNILFAQEKKIWRLSHQLKNTSSSIQLERKLAAKLWKLGRDFGIETEEGIEIDVNMSITFLADMLGTSRETTSRTCTLLTEAGLIKINKKRITIIDRDKMLEFYKCGNIKML